MAKPNPSFQKRQRERRRQEKKEEKNRKKAERKRDHPGPPEAEEGQDPDIAGIVPGPQPRPYEVNDDDAKPGA